MQSNIKSEQEVYFPWQDVQWERLISQMNSKKLPHAFSLLGPSFIGKQNFLKEKFFYQTYLDHRPDKQKMRQ